MVARRRGSENALEEVVWGGRGERCEVD